MKTDLVKGVHHYANLTYLLLKLGVMNFGEYEDFVNYMVKAEVAKIRLGEL